MIMYGGGGTLPAPSMHAIAHRSPPAAVGVFAGLLSGWARVVDLLLGRGPVVPMPHNMVIGSRVGGPHSVTHGGDWLKDRWVPHRYCLEGGCHVCHT